MTSRKAHDFRVCRCEECQEFKEDTRKRKREARARNDALREKHGVVYPPKAPKRAARGAPVAASARAEPEPSGPAAAGDGAADGGDDDGGDDDDDDDDDDGDGDDDASPPFVVAAAMSQWPGTQLTAPLASPAAPSQFLTAPSQGASGAAAEVAWDEPLRERVDALLPTDAADPRGAGARETRILGTRAAVPDARNPSAGSWLSSRAGRGSSRTATPWASTPMGLARTSRTSAPPSSTALGAPSSTTPDKAECAARARVWGA